MEYVVWMWVKEKLPPHVCAAIFSQTLVVEAVYCGDLPGLVVAPDECYAVWVADFEAQEEEEGFERVEAAVDEVAWMLLALVSHLSQMQ